MSLIIYGTVFNNSNRVKECINSLLPLGFKRIFVIDNYSTDGTYEILKSFGEIVKVERRKCSRGLGRQLALEMALKEANDNDFLMYVDFDTVYNAEYIRLIKQKMKNIKDGVFVFGMLSRAYINKRVPWRDLLTSEDLERFAHFKSIGVKLIMNKEQFDTVYGGKGLFNKYYQNDTTGEDNFYKRNLRYKTSNFKFWIRMMKVIIDDERGAAFKTFNEFYGMSRAKNPPRFFIFLIAYLVAHVLGVYSYSKTKNNIEYIKEDLL